MNKKIETFIDTTIEKEGNGKYTNDPNDSGGPTRWGITETTARAFGYKGDMSKLPREKAVQIYYKRYWEDPGFDLIEDVFPDLAAMLFDFGVLAGSVTAGKHLQRALNVLNRGGTDYPDLTVDGRIGCMTSESLRAFITKRGSDGMKIIKGMVASLNSAYLTELAERRPKDELYMYGWQLNRALGAI